MFGFQGFLPKTSLKMDTFRCIQEQDEWYQETCASIGTFPGVGLTIYLKISQQKWPIVQGFRVTGLILRHWDFKSFCKEVAKYRQTYATLLTKQEPVKFTTATQVHPMPSSRVSSPPKSLRRKRGKGVVEVPRAFCHIRQIAFSIRGSNDARLEDPPSWKTFHSWRGEGVTRAHTLESQVHTGAISHYFFHPESSAHTKLESHAHTGQFPGSHVHAEGESHSGGVGWGGGVRASAGAAWGGGWERLLPPSQGQRGRGGVRDESVRGTSSWWWQGRLLWAGDERARSCTGTGSIFWGWGQQTAGHSEQATWSATPRPGPL